MRPLITIFVFIAVNIFAQNIGIGVKFNTNFDNDYSSYKNISIHANISFFETIFELNSIVDLNYSEFDNGLLSYSTNKSSYYISDIIIPKIGFGISLVSYPYTFATYYTTFLGVKGAKLLDSKLPLILGGVYSSNIWSGGLYNFKTKNDYMFSLYSGLKISAKNNLHIIFEIEYQTRRFILEYKEYDDYISLVKTYSEYHTINALKIGIGLQYYF